jgi:hypothetical protein
MQIRTSHVRTLHQVKAFKDNVLYLMARQQRAMHLKARNGMVMHARANHI